MKKKNKVLLIISSILLILTFCFVIGIKIYTESKLNELEKQKEELAEKRRNESIEEYEAREQYIGIDWCFLGKVNNLNEWKSANEYYESSFVVNTPINVQKEEITADDILNQEYFFVYDENKFLNRNSNIFYDRDLNPEYYFEIDYFRFKLDEYYAEDYNEDLNLICVSKKLESNYSSRLEVVDDTLAYEKYVKEILDNKKLNSDIIIDKVIKIDSDDDSNMEEYILANCSYDEENLQDIYSFVIKVENEKTDIIMERIMKKSDFDKIQTIEQYFEIREINFIDFNNDGKEEFILETMVWDIPEKFVFTRNSENEFELCLYGCFAW